MPMRKLVVIGTVLLAAGCGGTPSTEVNAAAEVSQAVASQRQLAPGTVQ